MSNAHASGLDRTLHNLKNGFLEGVLRGCHRGLLSTHDYSKLMICETLDDVKTLLVTRRLGRDVFVSYLNLDVLQCSTDYRALLQDLPSPLHSSTIVSTCTQKMVDDFNIFRSQVGISAPKIFFNTRNLARMKSFTPLHNRQANRWERFWTFWRMATW